MSSHPTIVLGTGRCGSTLVSNMIRCHPAALSVSELFSFVTDLGTRVGRAFPPGAMSGRRFWEILASPQPRQSLLLSHGLAMAEVTYPLGAGRFTDVEVPPIAQALLPHLDPANPDALFDVVEAAVVRSPVRPIGDHYRHFFQLLQTYFGKETWVERSGGCLRFAARLVDLFPEARILHIVRDGRDTALSMSQHIGFRMALLCGMLTESLGIDPFECSDRTDEADLTDELAALLPERFSRAAFDAFDLAPSLCGDYWSGEIRAGLQVLESVPPDRLLTVRYEDLLSKPQRLTERIGTFISDETTDAWVAEAAALVEYRPSRLSRLPASERSALDDACEPGFEALAAHGLTWSQS